MKAFISWSGGKETSLSCYKVMQDENIKVAYLLNMVSEDGRYSRSHGVDSRLLNAQAQALGIPIIQKSTTWKTYEEVFKKALLELKNKDVDTGVFGDIDIQEHRDWVEGICKEVDIRPILPLWKREREELLEEFIQAGFKAIVVATQAHLLGKVWLGRQINQEFIEDLKELGIIDVCGENGEYHTFIYGGPIFESPLEFTIGKKILKDKHWFLRLKLK